MRRYTGWLFALILTFTGFAETTAQAQSGQAVPAPVVVELFTSQGCSSCPPADDYFLKHLAQRDDVIALALHVDYWDYIGWKDKFADPAFTKRQKSYAKASGHRSVYTPQMIVAGKDHVIGNHPKEVSALLRQHQAAPSPVQVSLRRNGQNVTIVAQSKQPVGQMTVQLVRYVENESVAISRGENAGKTVNYANIVNSWRIVGHWNGVGSASFNASAPGNMPVVAIVQKRGFGPIVAAARLR